MPTTLPLLSPRIAQCAKPLPIKAGPSLCQNFLVIKLFAHLSAIFCLIALRQNDHFFYSDLATRSKQNPYSYNLPLVFLCWSRTSLVWNHSHHRRTPTMPHGVRANQESYHVFSFTLPSMAALKDLAGQRGPKSAQQGPLISVTWERERIRSRHLNRLKELCCRQ